MEPKEIFDQCVEEFVGQQNELMEADGITNEPQTAEDLGLIYKFHEPNVVTVDGNLYDIMKYGSLWLNWGASLHTAIHNSMKEHGWLIEAQSGCDYIFFKHQ